MIDDLRKLLVDGENAGSYEKGYEILNSGLWAMVEKLDGENFDGNQVKTENDLESEDIIDDK